MKILLLNCSGELTCVFLDDMYHIIRFVYNSDSLNDARVPCYVHNGQHVYASIGYLRTGTPATQEEYAALLNELCSIGYDRNNVEVCQGSIVEFLDTVNEFF